MMSVLIVSPRMLRSLMALRTGFRCWLPPFMPWSLALVRSSRCLMRLAVSSSLALKPLNLAKSFYPTLKALILFRFNAKRAHVFARTK